MLYNLKSKLNAGKWMRYFMKLFEANKVCKKIDGNMLIKDLSISISQEEKVAITGKNGSGKSSLLKLIGGIYTSKEGRN